MICFPAPGAPAVPPCIVPGGLDPTMLDGTDGELELTRFSNGTTKVEITASGLDPSWTITAWISYYFPGPGSSPPNPEIFGDGSPGSGIAGASAPLAATTAGFTEGLGIEPNQMDADASGQGEIVVTLDYDPLTAAQGPLRNTLVDTNQADAQVGTGAEQGLCCGGIGQPTHQPVGSSYLRVFDSSGFQVVDAAGVPELLRSPVPVAFMLLVIHTDGTTHGINPGVPIFPFPGIPETAGDHFVLGIFDLSNL